MLKLGDKIWVWKSGVRHYGVVVEICRQGVVCVVHASKSSGVVELIELARFASGQIVNIEQRAPSGTECDVANRARRLLGRSYDLFAFNCEHAATYAMTGSARSDQLRAVAGAVGLVLGVGVAAWALSRLA